MPIRQPNRFVWVPCEDEQWDATVPRFTNERGCRCIPRSPGVPFAGLNMYKQWNDLAQFDWLRICGHGILTSTKHIGWVDKNGNVTKWTYRQLANTLRANLAAAHKLQSNLTIELLMCWGANSILWRDCFGSRLASELGGYGMNGRVIAYGGAVLISGKLNRAVSYGNGRFSSFLGRPGKDFDKINHAMPDVPVVDSSPVYVDKWNYYDAMANQKVWNLPA